MYPRGMATVHNALTMEERCMALERLRAVFCEDIADPTDFALYIDHTDHQ